MLLVMAAAGVLAPGRNLDRDYRVLAAPSRKRRGKIKQPPRKTQAQTGIRRAIRVAKRHRS
ncbi:MAG: hypothetical protein CVV27_04700 [Candidatus Melainabacteria bacterium HGW-Melainabacteria-1]|nr:MAG: hypothetical protein CVV27_04700 [Candidatus Melainabacteria bacterium HGW-Melainabacteria-1]